MKSETYRSFYRRWNFQRHNGVECFCTNCNCISNFEREFCKIHPTPKLQHLKNSKPQTRNDDSKTPSQLTISCEFGSEDIWKLNNSFRMIPETAAFDSRFPFSQTWTADLRIEAEPFHNSTTGDVTLVLYVSEWPVGHTSEITHVRPRWNLVVVRSHAQH